MVVDGACLQLVCGMIKLQTILLLQSRAVLPVAGYDPLQGLLDVDMDR
jgi:hypothetical protein